MAQEEEAPLVSAMLSRQKDALLPPAFSNPICTLGSPLNTLNTNRTHARAHASTPQCCADKPLLNTVHADACPGRHACQHTRYTENQGSCLRPQEVRAVGNGKGNAARLTGGADGKGAAELRERDGELRVGALRARGRRALQRHRAAVALVVIIADGHLPLKQSACSSPLVH